MPQHLIKIYLPLNYTEVKIPILPYNQHLLAPGPESLKIKLSFQTGGHVGFCGRCHTPFSYALHCAIS